ncbi:hypothetical protein ILUMI_23442 [Ignelater luminosus]|uniref:Peptidase S1 domain-containing protein n=1 Tax=Ignelater luminosus TaxID=2038154 RepID=A0A8K0CAV7_IGNLU|nr:hypothetical protein ILUMI_23442 [Ignelater luminosus]
MRSAPPPSPTPWRHQGLRDVQIPLSEHAKVVTLPPQDEDPPADSWAVLAGWGHRFTSGSIMKNLQRVDILVYSDEDCKAAHGSKVSPAYHVCSVVPERCKGHCNGDSGGPLVADGKQIS